MARAKKICAKPGCPETTAASYCTQHAREVDKARGTSTQRGYGTRHNNARKAIAPAVESGTIACARCGQPILKGQPWHLDHNDDDRSKYLGPSHSACNTSAGGKRSHLNPFD